MSGLGPAVLLDVAARGRARHPVDRALLLLDAAAPGSGDSLATLPLAARDRRLLALRAELLGDRLDCIADCPACGTALGFELSAGTLQAACAEPADETLEHGGWSLTLRSLDSRDLAAAARTGAAVEAEALLLARAIARIEPPTPTETVAPAPLLDLAAARVAAREAGGVTELALDCPACGNGWTAAFDVAAHVWTEFDAAARRLLDEVVALAGRFHWSEAELLAMPAARRRAYLAAG